MISKSYCFSSSITLSGAVALLVKAKRAGDLLDVRQRRLNAFAASTFGYDFAVIHSELFSNTYDKNKDALAFIIGHELGHLRLGHTRLWHQLSTAYVDRVPLLGGFVSRAREFSCDRHGAYLAPRARRVWCCSRPDDTSTNRLTSSSC